MNSKKKIKNDDLDNNSVLYSLPYYGKTNTIASVTLPADSHVCYVTRYGDNGELGKVFPVPKKYLKKVEDNYISDLKDFLLNTGDRYQSARFSSDKVSKLKVLAISSSSFSILFATMLGTIFTNGSLAMVNSLGFVTSFIGTCYSTTQIKKYIQSVKDKKFMKEYQNQEKILNHYNISNANKKSERTKYHGVTLGYTDDLDLSLIRAKKKNEKY